MVYYFCVSLSAKHFHITTSPSLRLSSLNSVMKRVKVEHRADKHDD